MPRQLILDLPVKAATGRDDFFVSTSNAQAVTLLENWGHWPQGKLALIGPAGSGKSHLTQIWAEETGGVIWPGDRLADMDPARLPSEARLAIEDAATVAGDPAAERTLFHIHNLVLSGGGRLLLTAREMPNRWRLNLPDLQSRLSATTPAALTAPDDNLLAALLVKLFHDRQLVVPEAVISYLVRRIDRSFAAATATVAEIDRRALAERRPVTRNLAAQVLDSAPFGAA